MWILGGACGNRQNQGGGGRGTKDALNDAGQATVTEVLADKAVCAVLTVTSHNPLRTAEARVSFVMGAVTDSSPLHLIPEHPFPTSPVIPIGKLSELV